jgi:Transposase and inactivated derivatives
MRCSVSINGAQRYLWRAVDQHGNVLDILVGSRRNAVAAKKFFRRLLKGLRYVPGVIVTTSSPATRWRTASSCVGAASPVEVPEHSY